MDNLDLYTKFENRSDPRHDIEPDVYDKAADLVLSGWTQGNYDDGHGNLCALGAIYLACGANCRGWMHDVYGTFSYPSGFEEFVNRNASDREVTTIPAWNDTPGRTAGEVADALRTYAKELREDAGNA